MADLPALVAVFEEARALVLREGNDFSWSGWEDAAEAVAEVDAVLGRLREGRLAGPYMSVLFLPTGPLQELSVSSGWGDEFVELADRFDHALAAP